MAKNRITRKQLNHALVQLTLLIKAGIPISQACEFVANGSHLSNIKILFQQINQQLKAGLNFSQALQQHPRHFNAIDFALVNSGEQSGQLVCALTALTRYYQQRYQYRHQLIKTLFYPGTVFCLAIVITAGMIKFVFPQFQQLLADFGGRLPGLTKLMLLLSKTLNHHSATLVSLVLLLITAGYYAVSQTRGRYYYHLLLLNIPYLKRIVMTNHLTTWSQVLAMTSNAKVPLHQALQLAQTAVNNRYIKSRLFNVANSIQHGNSLYNAMKKTNLFTLPTLQLIAVGENTATLSDILGKIAEHYQQQLESLLARLNECLEPLIMLLLAVLIGTLIIAMYLPILQIGAAL